MKEIYSPFLEARANRCGKSPRSSGETPARSQESSNETPLQSIPAITLLTRLENRADNRASESRTHKRLKNDSIRRYVEDRIRDGWSPELIAGRIRIRHSDLPISHEAIYQWVYTEARHLIRFLVRAHRKRQRRGYSRKHRKTHILREGLNPKTSSKRV